MSCGPFQTETLPTSSIPCGNPTIWSILMGCRCPTCSRRDGARGRRLPASAVHRARRANRADIGGWHAGGLMTGLSRLEAPAARDVGPAHAASPDDLAENRRALRSSVRRRDSPTRQRSHHASTSSSCHCRLRRARLRRVDMKAMNASARIPIHSAEPLVTTGIQLVQRR